MSFGGRCLAAGLGSLCWWFLCLPVAGYGCGCDWFPWLLGLWIV